MFKIGDRVKCEKSGIEFTGKVVEAPLSPEANTFIKILLDDAETHPEKYKNNVNAGYFTLSCKLADKYLIKLNAEPLIGTTLLGWLDERLKNKI